MTTRVTLRQRDVTLRHVTSREDSGDREMPGEGTLVCGQLHGMPFKGIQKGGLLNNEMSLDIVTQSYTFSIYVCVCIYVCMAEHRDAHHVKTCVYIL